MSHPQYKNIGSPETRMIEECSELTQALCKATRFGWFNFHPDRPNETNLDDVRREMDDVLEAMNKLDIHLRELTYERFKDEAELSGLIACAVLMDGLAVTGHQRRKEPAMTMKWCICNGQGTCYGCAIEKTIRDEYGTQGTAFVRSMIAAEIEPIAWAVLSTHSGDEQEVDLFENRDDAVQHAKDNGGVVAPLVTPNAELCGIAKQCPSE